MSIFARHALEKYQQDPIQVSVILFRHIGILLRHNSNSRFNIRLTTTKEEVFNFCPTTVETVIESIKANVEEGNIVSINFNTNGIIH